MGCAFIILEMAAKGRKRAGPGRGLLNVGVALHQLHQGRNANNAKMREGCEYDQDSSIYFAGIGFHVRNTVPF